MRSTLLGRTVLAVFAARTWLAMIYLLSGLPIAVVTFTLAIVGVALSVGLLPLALLGVPVAALTLVACSGLATLERARAALMLDVRITPPVYRSAGDKGGWARGRVVLKDPARWRQLAGVVLGLPFTTCGFAVAASVWGVAVALLFLPAYNSHLPNGRASAFGWGIVGTSDMVASVVCGALLLMMAPWATWACARANVWLDKALFGLPAAQLAAARVGELEQSRTRMVVAADTDRRRLERDLHDGAQARLVSLAMDLGRARTHLDDDPQAARALVEQAHEQAKTALAELRSLVRGLHPPVLADRGLDAALSGLAALCPVPVTVSVKLQTRPSQTVEAIAYFIVAEALTNVAKHAQATSASVTVRSDSQVLHVVVRDDGRGGARPGGPGLTGLADRAQAVDGRLWVRSPLGGPTEIEAELPCA
ncbi:MAG TPA: sensor domain-containing protein [Acidimicrobiales bacterium]|nr:sensor domain-containing protein [Acidimicrobiales bacterium]